MCGGVDVRWCDSSHMRIILWSARRWAAMIKEGSVRRVHHHIVMMLRVQTVFLIIALFFHNVVVVVPPSDLPWLVWR